MSKFDKVIGYEAIKNELLEICDMIHNREVYEKLGARLPKGLMLSGDPGLGKTLMTKCFIEESGLPAITVRRTKGTDDFVDDITEAFRKAKENAPCIVFLDDMDKFANEDSNHRDAEEYVAVQAGIDDVRDCDVFVIATVNEEHKLPKSLTRAGRFDRKITVFCPSETDAEKIIEYYLSDKKLSDDVNMNDLCKMMSYKSCAELETVLNEAAIRAARARKSTIEMSDLVAAVLRMQYDSPDNKRELSEQEMRKIAVHEAGHLVVAEALVPKSIGLVSVRSTGESNTRGFTHACGEQSEEGVILVSLAGKAAAEMYYSGSRDDGCESDISRASEIIRERIRNEAALGFGTFDVSGCYKESYSSLEAQEYVTRAELERYMFKVKDILIRNRDLLERAANALVEKETLLFSDIQELKNECASIKAA